MSEQERADVDRGANEIIYKPVADLVPYVNNAKVHQDEQISAIAASIKEFGFNNPILIDGENGVIAGHGRLMAAKKLKLAQVPCIELAHLSDAQRRAYILADNRLAEIHTDWDMELVQSELAALEAEGFDVELTGFDFYGEEAEEVELPDLTDGEREPFQQKTFTLHDDQAEVVERAIELARTSPIVDTGMNENTNGNALALICEQWLRQNS